MSSDALSRSAGSLAGKVAIVTGGSRGIGLAIAQAFVDADARVIVTGRTDAALSEAAATRPGHIDTFRGDAGDSSAITACIGQAMERHGRIDILVNNVGGPLNFGALLDLPAESFEATMALNLLAPFHWSRAVWKTAMKAHGGTIINISSVSGTQPVRAMGAYSIGKSALDAMTRVLAGELGPKVRVNGIAPGLTRTDATAPFAGRGDLAEAIPLGRVGEAHEIAAAALFLAGDQAAWVTGQVLAVDGGTLVGDRRLQHREASDDD